MSEFFADDPTVRGILSSAFRAIRRLRGLSARDVAAVMEMPLRSYEHLEAGRGRLTLARLRAFSEATDCDFFALLLCGPLGSPDFAVRCADNKLATILIMGMEDLSAARNDRIAALKAATILAAFGDAFRGLARAAAEARSAAPPKNAPLALDPVENLTERQLECLRWVQVGKSSGDIGGILGLSARTVDDHVASACRWLGVRTRLQAVQTAVSRGIIAPYP